MSGAAWIEALAAAMGLLGTALLACKSRWAGWGFVAYLVSNVGWLWFATQHGHWGLFWQQVGFTFFSLVGIRQWLLVPVDEALERAFDWGDGK